MKYGATLKGAVSGCVELDEFVEMWETLTGESIDDVVAIAEAHADRQAGRSPKVDPLRDNFDAFDVDHNGTTARPALYLLPPAHSPAAAAAADTLLAVVCNVMC